MLLRLELLLVERAEQAVHLLPVDARRESRSFRPGPLVLGVRLVVALVQLECLHALEDQLAAVAADAPAIELGTSIVPVYGRHPIALAAQALTAQAATGGRLVLGIGASHQVLVEEGYAYSSSVAPVRHDHYGWPDAPRFAFRPVAGADLVELPVTVARIGNRHLATGGGFFRLFPSALTNWAVRQVNAEERPAIFYFHPWEVDPGQPRVAGAPLKSRLRHYSRLGAMAGKLRTLVKRHDWGRVDQVVAAERGRLP